MAVPLVNGHVLLAARPDWVDGAEIILQWQTSMALAQRGNEDRAALRALPQAQVAWNVVANTPEDAAALEDNIRAALRSGQACAPCYPRACYPAYFEYANTLLVLQPSPWSWAVGDYLYARGLDGTGTCVQIKAVQGNQLTLSASVPTSPVVWPVVFGRLEVEQPEQEAPDTLKLTCRLYLPQWKLPTASTQPAAYLGTPLMPAAVTTDWSDVVERAFNYNPAVEQIGYGAETLETEQSYVQHGVTITALLKTETAISDLEAFVGGLGGRRGNFWLPAQERAMLIKQGTAANAFQIVAQGLTDTWQSQPAQVLYFYKQGQTPMIARMTGVQAVDTTTEGVTLDAALPVVVDASWDVYLLRLMRFADDDLKEEYEADNLCTVRLATVECPLEYYVALLSPQPAYLYRFTANLTPAVEWFNTSHAQPLTVGGQTWTPLAISHAEITRSMESSDESATLTTQFSVDSPLAQFLPFPPSFRMRVVISRYDLSNPGAAPTVEFTGYVRSPKLIGRKIEAKVQCPIDFLDRQALSFFIGFLCNARLYGAGCNLNAEDWRVNAQIAAVGGVGLALAADPGVVANYFAFGHLVVGAGITTEVRTIMRSSGQSLVLNFPLLKNGPGAAVALYPGCSHMPPDCQNKFNNWVNYRGHPKIPKTNPTLNAIDSSGSGGKK